jgi:hypothetical protein
MVPVPQGQLKTETARSDPHERMLECGAAPTALGLLRRATQAFRPGLKFGAGPCGPGLRTPIVHVHSSLNLPATTTFKTAMGWIEMGGRDRNFSSGLLFSAWLC